MNETEAANEKYLQKLKDSADALKARQEAAPPPPSIISLCLEHTLYSGIQINPERDQEYLDSVKFNTVQFDAYCVYCRKNGPFRTWEGRTPSSVTQVWRIRGLDPEQLKCLVFAGGQFALHLACMRNPGHIYSYFFHYNEKQGVLTKIGQTPSLEDIAGADIERYRKILGDNFTELRKATGLFAHGIGIGSFVYLRRIFEKLIEEARMAANLTAEQENAFRKMRMIERVSELAAYLPSAVVQHKDAYGILSKGLHELTEVECKKYFPVVRAAVIMMLEQKYEADEKAKAEDELKRAMTAIASEINGEK